MIRPGTPVFIARLLVALMMGVFFGSSLCYGWGSGHWKITQAALDSLPLDNAEAKPYLVVVKGRLLHYFPRDNREDYLVFSEGAERYVRLIIISLDDDPRFVVRLDGYRPQLLGMHPKEVAFHLYARCCRFSYEIPAAVFQEFRCTAGLHSQLGLHPSGANLRLTVRFGGQVVFDSGVLEAGSPAQQVAIPVVAGGTLEFVSEGHPRPAGNEANHAVWGEPVLIRLDSAEAPAAAPVKPPSARTS